MNIEASLFFNVIAGVVLFVLLNALIPVKKASGEPAETSNYPLSL